MTPAQLSALKAEILGRADCSAAVSARDLDTIAALISTGRKATQLRFVTARTIFGECAGGQGIYDALNAAATGNSAVKMAVNFLNQDSGLDIGNPATQGMIDQLMAGTAPALTAAQGASLKALANLPQTISRLDVEAALFNANGTAK